MPTSSLHSHIVTSSIVFACPLIDIRIRLLIIVTPMLRAIALIAGVIFIIDFFILIAIKDFRLRSHHSRMLLNNATTDCSLSQIIPSISRVETL